MCSDRFKDEAKQVYNAWVVGLLGPAMGRIWLFFKRPFAVLYGLIVIAFLSGCGTWLTVLLYERGLAKPQELALSIFTYTLALVGTSITDVVWAKDSGRSLMIWTILIGLLALCLPALEIWRFFGPSVPDASAQNLASPYDPFRGLAWSHSITLVGPPFLCWLFANIVDDKFGNDDPAAAVGGNPLQALV